MDLEHLSLNELREAREALLRQLHYGIGVGNVHKWADKNAELPYLVVFEPIIPTSFRGLEVRVLKSTRLLNNTRFIEAE